MKITRIWSKIAFVGCAALLIASIAVAQSGGGFDLSWSTVDGGGDTSVGGTYSLTGSIGQHDAGPAMAGGSFSLQGGFMTGVGEDGTAARDSWTRY